MADDDLSKLVLNPITVPRYSARAILQSYEPIQQAAQMHYTSTGKLINLGVPTFELYRTFITCLDIHSPALSGVWPGRKLQVHCVQYLGYETAAGFPDWRDIVPGSQYVEGDTTYYLPIMVVRVMRYSSTENERDKQVNWELELMESREAYP